MTEITLPLTKLRELLAEAYHTGTQDGESAFTAYEKGVAEVALEILERLVRE